jgi:hypothetical protein
MYGNLRKELKTKYSKQLESRKLPTTGAFTKAGQDKITSAINFTSISVNGRRHVLMRRGMLLRS